MRTKILIALFLLLSLNLYSESLSSTFIINTGVFYPRMPKISYGSPVLGAKIDGDVYSIIGDVGIGGSYYTSFKSYDSSFDYLRRSEVYLHNFWNLKQDITYSAHGLYAGIAHSKLGYHIDEVDELVEHEVTKPIIGYRLATDYFALTVSWSQNQSDKSIFSYAIKMRNKHGISFQLIRHTRGLTEDIKSELMLHAGLELFF